MAPSHGSDTPFPVTPEYIKFLDTQNSYSDIRRMKALMVDLLALSKGDRLLDVGCGTGDDAREIASAYRAEGVQVTGIDQSPAMIAEASRRNRGFEIAPEFVAGDVTDLPYEDAMFDALRCERVFQWLDQAEPALHELLRVLRPGGRLVICEEDWGTSAYGYMPTELVDRLNVLSCDAFPMRRVARELPSLYNMLELKDIRVEPMLLVVRPEEFRDEHKLIYAGELSAAVKACLLSDDERSAMLQAWREGFADGVFMELRVFYIVGGTKAS